MPRQMRVYRGSRMPSGCAVIVNGSSLPPCTDLRNHSPTGFEWGYSGSGPAQLALAILADHFQHGLGRNAADADGLALRHYQQFKVDVISCLPEYAWEFSTAKIEASAAGRQRDLL